MARSHVLYILRFEFEREIWVYESHADYIKFKDTFILHHAYFFFRSVFRPDRDETVQCILRWSQLGRYVPILP